MYQNIKKIFHHKYLLLIFIVISLVPFFWLRGGIPIAFWDTPTFSLYYPEMNMPYYLKMYAWDSMNSTGFPEEPYNSIGFILSRFYILLHSMVNNHIALGQAIFLFTILLLSLLSMYLLVSELFSNKKEKKMIAFLSSIFYVLNTGTLFYYFHTLDGSIYLVPFIPLFFYFVVRIAKKGNFLNAFLLSIFFAIFSYAFCKTPRIIMIFFMGALLYLLFSNVRKLKIKFLLFTILMVVLINSFFIVPFIGTYSSKYTEIAEAANIKEMFKYASKSVSILSSFQIKPDADSLMWHIKQPDWKLYYYENPFFIFLSFFFLFIIFIPILGIKKEIKTTKKILLFFSAIALISLFFSKGNNIPFGNLNQYIILNVLPFSRAFVSPPRFFVLTIPSYSILFGYGANLIADVIDKKIGKS